MNERERDIARFYDLLAQLEENLGGKRILKDCTGRMEWPLRGVYFFFEPGEMRNTESSSLRVVRVGTHAVSKDSRQTLWKRLRQHRGTRKGTGNHRGSVFRKHIGAALINKDQLDVPTWLNLKNPKLAKEKEAFLERRVSDYIGQMPFLWLEVDDLPSATSKRASIERNSIVLLAGEHGNSSADPPSDNWLGFYSPEDRIRNSGLWNIDHVGTSSYDSDFIALMTHYVEAME